MKTQSFTEFAAARRVTFTPAQSVLFRVVFDGIDPDTLEGTDADLARTIFGVVVGVIFGLARETIAIVKGARIGGSRFSALRALHLALTIDLSTLAPGEEAFILFVAPDLRLARQTMRFALGAVRADPALAKLLDGEPGKDGFAIRRGRRRIVFTCLPATRGGSAVRARSIICAVLSEAAFFRDSDSEINDAEIYRAIAPRIIPGGQTILESTPWLSSGLLFELFRDNHGAPTTALVAHAPTLLMRPDARTRAIVEAEAQRDPDNSAREHGAEFIGGDASAFFDPVSVERAVDRSRPSVTSAKPGWSAGAGADLALISDSSTLAIVAYDGVSLFDLLELVEERPKKGAPLKLSRVIANDAVVLRAHGLASVTADGHVREPAREYADAEKITITAAPEGQRGKSETYQALRQAFREGRITIPHDARLLAQLRAIVARPTPGGGISISSPRSRAGHGDLVSALVLAVHAARHSSFALTVAPPVVTHAAATDGVFGASLGGGGVSVGGGSRSPVREWLGTFENDPYRY